MTKKEECFKFFDNNSGMTREEAIKAVMSKLNITKTTAWTYYPAWRKEFMSKPGHVSSQNLKKEEKLKIITKNVDIVTEMGKKSPKALEKSQKEDIINKEISDIVSNDFSESKKNFIEKSEKITSEAKETAAKRTEELISSINETIYSVETDKKKEDIFEVTRLVPIVMQGKYGDYRFTKEGVKATPYEDFISKDKMEESMEALEIWERCYGKGGSQSC